MTSKPRLQRGFTLVEVLVALIVVGVALPALLSQVMTQVDGTAALRDKTVAHWVAQNQWTRIQLQHRLSGKLQSGSATGEAEMLEQSWQWRVETADTELVRRLTISVGHPDQEPLVVFMGALDY